MLFRWAHVPTGAPAHVRGGITNRGANKVAPVNNSLYADALAPFLEEVERLRPADAEVFDAGQISKLLARLEGYGLIENLGAGHVHGAPNEWRITRRGVDVDRAIRRRFAADGVSRRTQ